MPTYGEAIKASEQIGVTNALLVLVVMALIFIIAMMFSHIKQLNKDHAAERREWYNALGTDRKEQTEELRRQTTLLALISERVGIPPNVHADVTVRHPESRQWSSG